jgi:ectoine hydroxylase-related dioxygenase (phytanoyl-CoA dioxygenase family)
LTPGATSATQEDVLRASISASLRRLLNRSASKPDSTSSKLDRAPRARPILDGQKQLISSLWLDQVDAHARIDRHVDEGTLPIEDAPRLHHFVDHGYATLSIPIDDAFVAAFERDIDAVWDARPPDLAVSPVYGEKTSFRDFEGVRHAGYRIPDLHSHSGVARQLYLHPDIFRVVAQIFDAEPIAFQSLYFEYGSGQGLHRDPMFVGVEPPGNLVASWIALEDVTLDSGPLLYAPGSHRMPWFEFEPDSVAMLDKSPAKKQAWTAHRDRVCSDMGLEARPFTCQRGDVFLWHAGLLHGGAPVKDGRLTRKSFVTHYSTRAQYTSRRASVRIRANDGSWHRAVATTRDLIEQHGCKGLDGPFRHLDPKFLRTEHRR